MYFGRRFGGAGIRRGLRAPSGGVAPWSPLDDPGLQAWYDPSDPAYRTLDGSNRFEALADKRGLREPVEQSTGGNRPTLSTLGGRDALGLDGSRWLRGSWASTLAAPYVSIVVAQVTGTGATYVLVDNAATNNSGAVFFASGDWRSSSGTVLSSGNTTRGGLRAHLALNGASGAYYLDNFGTAIVSGANGTNVANGRTIGRNNATGGSVEGVIGDHIITTSSDATTRANYARWLSARYSGLTVVP